MYETLLEESNATNVLVEPLFHCIEEYTPKDITITESRSQVAGSPIVNAIAVRSKSSAMCRPAPVAIHNWLSKYSISFNTELVIGVLEELNMESESILASKR